MLNWILSFLPCFDACPIIFSHSRLVVVQSFGAAEKVRCTKCGKYFGMHHELETILPWNAEFEHFYSVNLGYGPTLK